MNFFRDILLIKRDLFDEYKYDEKSEKDKEMLQQVARTITDLGSICYQQCHKEGNSQYDEKCVKRCTHDYIHGVDEILKHKQSQRN